MKKTSFLILCVALVSPLCAAEPGQLELARKVINATQFDRMFDQMGAQMQQIAAQSMSQSSPNMSEEQRAAATKIMSEITALSMEAAKGMLQKVDVIYADVYTEAELKAMLAFFESNEGKSMLLKQPKVMQALMPLVQGMQGELMPKIQSIVERAKATTEKPSAEMTPAAPSAPKVN